MMIICCVFGKVWIMNAPATAYWQPIKVKNDENFGFNNFSRNWFWSCEKWSKETNFYETHVPKGMCAPHLCHIYEEKSHFQMTSPLKLLGLLGPYFIFSIKGKVELKFVFFMQIWKWRWPACPYMVKTLQKSSSPELLKGFKPNFIWSMWEPWWSYFAFFEKFG